jgi:hypothetical protein
VSNIRLDNYFKPRERGLKSVSQALGQRIMKYIIYTLSLLAVVSVCHGSEVLPPSTGISVTGTWEFVHLDGSIKSGTWTHKSDMVYANHSLDGEEYAKSKGKTGSLSLWWDRDKKRPCFLQEYINGLEHGYRMGWYPSGQLQFAGRLIREKMASGTWWREDGTRHAELIANGDVAVSVDRDEKGEIQSIVEFSPPWKPMKEEPQHNPAPYPEPRKSAAQER